MGHCYGHDSPEKVKVTLSPSAAEKHGDALRRIFVEHEVKGSLETKEDAAPRIEGCEDRALLADIVAVFVA